MGRFGYLNEELFHQHEAERKRRLKRRDEIREKWIDDAERIEEENLSMLQREARREARIIYEDAARTVKEFDELTILWDCINENEQERLLKQVPKRTEILTDSEYIRCETIIPVPLKHNWWRQLISGSFIDVIYDCPHEISELSSSKPVYDLTVQLSEKQKEIFYYWSIRLWTPQKIAAMRGQSDRNIRKVYNKMIDDIRHKMFERLYCRYERYWNLTTSQVDFVEWYIRKYSKGNIRPKHTDEDKATLRREEH